VEPGLRLRARERLRTAGLEGWAEQLREQGEASIVAALARVAEFQGWAGLDPSLAEKLLASLGVTGLEVRGARTGNILWCHGDGEPGTEVRSGRLLVVPLGGEVSDDPGWSLVKALLELYLPSSPGSGRDDDPDDTGFVGSSEAARILRRDIRSLAPSHLPIVILGETGVGKEVAARAIHRLSGRRGSFVAVNVNAIPTNLLESELFGSVRGAFTGAERSRQGLIMAAHHGTLFLDEIGDLDPPLQVKLLRFLEGQEIRPVGSDRTQVVDVRILSATHRDLEARVRDGRFRHDLYYRLAMCPLVIPPLRERREDIEDLVEHFQREAVDRYGLQPVFWSSQASSALRGYHWPGNARELQKAVEVAMVRAAGNVVRGEHLPIGGESDDLPAKTWDEAQREFRASYLTAALRRNRGNRSATARELGISRQALLYHLRRLGLTDSEKT
jgi:DNA-binding NtrC family response regulator